MRVFETHIGSCRFQLLSLVEWTGQTTREDKPGYIPVAKPGNRETDEGVYLTQTDSHQGKYDCLKIP